MISVAVKRLHQLAWQPGLWMQSSWWDSLGLASWMTMYQNYPSTRFAIDRIIIARRQFPQQSLPAYLDDTAAALLVNESRLEQLISVIGLIRHESRDVLCLGHTRRILVAYLGRQMCDQLLAMHLPWGGRSHGMTKLDLLELLNTGYRWLFSCRYGHMPLVLNALAIKLPAKVLVSISSDTHKSGSECDISNDSCAPEPFSLLRKLVRFL